MMTTPAYGIRAIVLALAFVAPLAAQDETQSRVTPWGISSSASSFRNHEEWFPKMKAAGVSTIRMFPEWRSFEPEAGKWHWADGDRLMKSAAEHQLEINAILMGSPPGAKAVHAFPMDALADWSAYVSAVVGRYGDQVRYWEVWNEGNGGFNDGRHTTNDYARLAVATYEAAKKADPQAKVGLSVASFDAPYLHQAIRSMTDAGKPDRFDYLCIHPYEIVLASSPQIHGALFPSPFVDLNPGSDLPHRASWPSSGTDHLVRLGGFSGREWP